jgi:hypothetical protein
MTLSVYYKYDHKRINTIPYYHPSRKMYTIFLYLVMPMCPKHQTTTKREITTMEERITIRQVALAINIDPTAFMLIEELEAILTTQHDIYKFMTKAVGLDCNQPVLNGKLYVKTKGNNWIELKGIIELIRLEQGCH